MSPLETDHTRRFTDRADYYAAFRPAYPDAVHERLRRDAHFDPAATVVDVGSGTGLSSELFLRHGHTVLALEPNAAMRREAEHALRGYEHFHSIAGTAEQIPLIAECAGLVVAGSAFHWFQPDEARAEFRRILKPGGLAILMGNTRRKDTSPFMRDYDAVIRQYSTRSSAHDFREERIAAFLLSASGMAGQHIDYREWLDLRQLIGRTLSFSVMPLAGQPGHDEMMRDVERVFSAHAVDGRVPYDGRVRLNWSQLQA